MKGIYYIIKVNAYHMCIKMQNTIYIRDIEITLFFVNKDEWMFILNTTYLVPKF
jgi:hypothetical protein